MNCERCYVYLSDRDGKVMCREHIHARDSDCIANLRAALAHERDRARRVVRVFWRVRSEAAGGILLEAERGYAMHYAKQRPGVRKVYRVTVRRKAKT